MSEILEMTYIAVGIIFVVAISMCMIVTCFNSLVNIWKDRKRNAYEDWAKNVCSQIDRWCDHEFPQVGYTMRELSKCISSGWSYDPSIFRENLRHGQYRRKGSEAPDAKA